MNFANEVVADTPKAPEWLKIEGRCFWDSLGLRGVVSALTQGVVRSLRVVGLVVSHSLQ